jgi:hypothetical protein
MRDAAGHRRASGRDVMPHGQTLPGQALPRRSLFSSTDRRDVLAPASRTFPSALDTDPIKAVVVLVVPNGSLDARPQASPGHGRAYGSVNHEEVGMRRLAMVLTLVVLSAGCASPAATERWTFQRPSTSEAQVKQGANECVAQSLGATDFDRPGLVRSARRSSDRRNQAVDVFRSQPHG